MNANKPFFEQSRAFFNLAWVYVAFEIIKLWRKKYGITRKILALGRVYITRQGIIFWGDLKKVWEEIEENGEKIISEMYMKYPEYFMTDYFYRMIHGFESIYKKIDREIFQEMVYELFPSKSEIDIYFRENCG